jgi:hypothetical protein
VPEKGLEAESERASERASERESARARERERERRAGKCWRKAGEGRKLPCVIMYLSQSTLSVSLSSTRCHMVGPKRPEAVLTDRALYLPTFSHFLIVYEAFPLSHPPPALPPSLSLSPSLPPSLSSSMAKFRKVFLSTSDRLRLVCFFFVPQYK